MLEELGFRERLPRWEVPPDAEQLSAFRVVIVGGGVSGICAAVALSRLGIEYTVVERESTVGGTWHVNRYPGCGVDTPSHLYSYSFQRHNWSRFFAKQTEIHGYLESCADTYDLRDRILLDTTVLGADFDESTSTWAVGIRRPDGTEQTLTANVLISAVGQLSQAQIPGIAGAESFTGPQAHSAHWPADLDLSGKRVAVIGSGASAMQLVPAIAGQAAHVTVFQRSPQWASYSSNYARDVPEGVRYLMERVPLYAAWYRCRLLWAFSDRMYESLRIDPDWDTGGSSINAANEAHRRYFAGYLTEQLAGRPDLIEKSLPDYPPFAKRMLIDNGWYRTISRPDVELVDSEVCRIDPGGVLDASGGRHPVDAIVYATGFQTLRMIGSYEVRGRNGKSLRDQWGEDDARAHLGTTVPGFPNFFCLYGPNTGLGHGGSLILLTECATRYVMKVIRHMITDRLAAVEIRHDVFERYNEDVDEAHTALVWSYPGVANWFRNQRGRVVTNWPWRVVDYWRRTLEPDMTEFHTETKKS
jgi:4-hydroxyacetophenone monooxygenase